MTALTIAPVHGLPELREGDDLARLIAESAELQDRDVLVVAQKAISKIEGRVVRLDDVEPSPRAREIAGEGDARRIEVILREAKRVVRTRGSLVITETRHGFVCASNGVDASNAPEPGTLVLLPVDPDDSAARLRAGLRDLTGRDVGVVVSDSFGRPWRQGTTDVAVGAAGIEVLRDLRGERDPNGYELRSTVIALADEIAGAAELVLGKLDRVPVAIVRGLDARGDGRARDLVMPPERNLFSVARLAARLANPQPRLRARRAHKNHMSRPRRADRRLNICRNRGKGLSYGTQVLTGIARVRDRVPRAPWSTRHPGSRDGGGRDLPPVRGGRDRQLHGHRDL